ncbi:hypothetical protein ACP70R_046792 [Stipagrostis hirtigluma subsp. patula]
MMKIVVAICICLLLVSSAHEVESRSHPRRRPNKPLFVFGDSFVDAGNLPRIRRNVTSRGWYYPYGRSDDDHGNVATGRFSDGLVQSDLVAKILGLEGSPRPYRLQQNLDETDRSGVNFATARSGVYEMFQGVPTLGNQISQFKSMIEDGMINDQYLKESVALISVSDSRDYAFVPRDANANNVASFIGSLTDEIADSVKQVQELGVGKVLVNSAPPLGCAPWLSWSNNYSRCDSQINMYANIHNTFLKQKIGESENVLLLDLYTTFSNIVEPNSGSTLSKQFKHKYTPCCDTSDPNDYCGQLDGRGHALYRLCDNPDKYFYWDYEHPTQAGWKAIMETLEESIKDFLDISSS